MNIGLTIAIIVMLIALSGLTFLFLKRDQYPTATTRQNALILLLGLAAGFLRALKDGGLARPSAALTVTSVAVEIAFFGMMLWQILRARKLKAGNLNQQ
jgi:uncharacterized membrane protein